MLKPIKIQLSTVSDMDIINVIARVKILFFTSSKKKKNFFARNMTIINTS